MEHNLFDIQNVTFRYEDVTALDDLSLVIPAGQRLAVLGANGSGKSTFLRLLDALYFADEGTVSAFGEPLTEAAFESEEFALRFRRRVGLIFQNPDVQLFNPTVFDEIAFGPLQLKWGKDEILNRITTAMDSFEIAHLKDRSPHRLSGGEKKRVALASVLILEPDVLLMDEPTAALDPKSRSKIIDFLADAVGSKRTIVVATHDLEMIEDIADYCYIFQSGRVVGQGTPREILADRTVLERANLLYSHRHAHDGVIHSHPHTPLHSHE